MPTQARLSVVIPALNEAASLPRLLEQLQAQTDVTLQVVVADGGSSDDTAAVAQSAGVALLRTPRGRGAQMNAGARATYGDWLLFLHADSELRTPDLLATALSALQRACESDGTHRIAGHFPLRFARAEPGHDEFFRYLEGKTALNRRYTVNGDQGLLIARRWFEELGGFDERLHFLEDQLLADRIFLEGRFMVLPGTLWTSARRFEAEGHAQRYTLMAIIMGLLAGSVEAFFQRAPQVYAAQRDAARLDLTPFARLIREIVGTLPWRERLAVYYRIGRFVRQNAWQLAYRRDLRRNDGELRCLSRFDRLLAPLIDNALFNALAGVLVCTWFYLWLPWRLQRERS